MEVNRKLKILRVPLLIIVIICSLASCRSDEVAGTWYLVENDNFGATLELHNGTAIFKDSEEFGDEEFEYIFEEDTLLLLDKENKEKKEIKFTLKEDDIHGKVLLKDGGIYACASREEAEGIIDEKQSAEEKKISKNIAIVEKQAEAVKKAIIGDWRASEITPSYQGMFSFYENGTYCWSIRDQYPSGRPPMEDKYVVSYDESYDGLTNPKKVEIVIRIYDNEEDCWIEFTYDEEEDVLLCKDESARGPYYRLTPSFEFENVVMIPQSTYDTTFLDYYTNVIPNTEVEWWSNDESIAKVNESGKVTAVSEGKTQIYALYRGKSYSFEVEVVYFDLEGVREVITVPASAKIKANIGGVYYWDGIADWMVDIEIYTTSGKLCGSADFNVHDSRDAKTIYINLD